MSSKTVEIVLIRLPRDRSKILYEEMFVSINIVVVDLFGCTKVISRPVNAISSQWGVPESAPYQLKCKLPTQIVVQLVCVVSHGCQWSGLFRGLDGTFGGTNDTSGSHAMSQIPVSIDPNDLVRDPSFLVGSTASPTRRL